MKACDNTLIASLVDYHLVKGAKGFHALAKKLHMPKEHEAGGHLMNGSVATTHFWDGKDGRTKAVVVLGDVSKLSHNELVSVLAHEATHIWQECRDGMDPAIINDEVEAYSIQSITFQLLEAL